MANMSIEIASVLTDSNHSLSYRQKHLEGVCLEIIVVQHCQRREGLSHRSKSTKTSVDFKGGLVYIDEI